MAEPLTPSGVFLRNGLLALGFDEASANEQVIAIEIEAADLAVKEIDAARAAAPLDVERLAAAIKNVTPWKHGGTPWAKAIAAEYARLTEDPRRG